MEMLPVDSSLIAQIGHNPATDTLAVQFRRGKVYHYTGIDQALFTQFATAPSPGSFYNQHIKARPFSIDGGTMPAPAEAPAPKPEPVPEPMPVPSIALTVTEAHPELARFESSDLCALADLIEVNSIQSQEEAGQYLLDIKQLRAEIERHHAPMKEAAYKAHKAVCDQEASLLNPIKAAEGALKLKIGKYVLAQQEATRKEEAARREQAKLEAEARARAEAEEQALTVAIELEAAGQMEDAEAVLAFPTPVAPRYIAPAPIQAQVARTAGVSVKSVWKARIVNLEELPREYMVPNESLLATVAARTGGRVKIKGVEFYEEASVSGSTRRRA